MLKSDGFASNLSSPDPQLHPEGLVRRRTASPMTTSSCRWRWRPSWTIPPGSRSAMCRCWKTARSSRCRAAATASPCGWTMARWWRRQRVVLAVGISWFKHMPDGAGRSAAGAGVALLRSSRSVALRRQEAAGAGRGLLGGGYRGAGAGSRRRCHACWRARRPSTITPCPIPMRCRG